LIGRKKKQGEGTMAKQTVAIINPNQIKTRIMCTQGNFVVHKDKKREQSKKKCRKKIKF
jgi:hypothetical protein